MQRFFVIVLGIALWLPSLIAQAPQAPPAQRPNIVLIMSDDMGWGDLGVYGGKDIKTPNIDSIARDGVRLTDFYSNGVLCSPTRAGLISGRYQQRYVIENALAGEGTFGLKVTGNSMPQVLKNAGYATALVGKWHLGGTVAGDKPKEGGPRAHGFDYFFGFMGSHDDYWHHNRGPMAPDLWENEKMINLDGQYLTTLITDRSMKFMEQNASAGKPFFIDVAYNAPHWPYQRPDKPSPPPGTGNHQLADQENTATRDDYRAMLEAVDKGVGEILRKLDSLGVANNTLVIFTNDNGGEWLANGGPLFNRKWTTWEGGIRVPAIFKWPGRIPRNKVSDQVGITMDLSATMIAAAGASVPTSYEGRNLLPVLEGRQPKMDRTLYWRTNVGNRTMKAIRNGDWKLVVDANHMFVFNLKDDVGERHDLTNERQDIARQLRPMLAKWEQEIDAEALVNAPTEAAAAQAAARGRGAGANAGGAGRGGAGRGAAPQNPD